MTHINKTNEQIIQEFKTVSLKTQQEQPKAITIHDFKGLTTAGGLQFLQHMKEEYPEALRLTALDIHKNVDILTLKTLKACFIDKPLTKATEYDICIAATHVLQSMASEIDFLKTAITSSITLSNSLNDRLVVVNKLILKTSVDTKDPIGTYCKNLHMLKEDYIAQKEFWETNNISPINEVSGLCDQIDS